MENLGIFNDYLVYFTAIVNILWSFGIFCDNLVGIFFPVLVFLTKKNLATLLTMRFNREATDMYAFTHLRFPPRSNTRHRDARGLERLEL
jgi:hypothetical protein